MPAESKKSSKVLTLDYVYGGDIVGEDLSHKKIEFHVNEGHIQVYDSNGEKIRLGELSRGERVIVAYLDSTGPSIPTATTVFRLPADYQANWGAEIEASHSSGDGAGRLSLADGGVEITLPRTWTVESPNGHQSASGKPILVARGTHFTSREQPSLYVYTQKTALASLEELDSRLRRVLLDDKEAVIQAESDLVVAGLPSHVIHFQGNLGDQLFHQDLVYVLKGDTVVLFLFAARPDDYGAFVGQFRLILGTLSVQ